jgi:hypothetical protein
MAALVAAISVGEAAPFPIEMAGESSPHAASVFFAGDGRAKRALRPAMTRNSFVPLYFDRIAACSG